MTAKALLILPDFSRVRGMCYTDYANLLTGLSPEIVDNQSLSRNYLADNVINRSI